MSLSQTYNITIMASDAEKKEDTKSAKDNFTSLICIRPFFVDQTSEIWHWFWNSKYMYNYCQIKTDVR